MSDDDGAQPRDTAEKTFGEIVAEVSEKASLLVREEIELAKAEVADKVSKLARGAAVGVAAGVFLVFALVFFLHALAWLITDALGEPPWTGYAIVVGILVLLAALAGFLAFRWLRKATPPTPELAIEEARRTRAELERQAVERDQLGRTLEKGREEG